MSLGIPSQPQQGALLDTSRYRPAKGLAGYNGYLLPRIFPISSAGALSLSLKHTAYYIIHTSLNLLIGLYFVLNFALSSLYAFALAHPTPALPG